MVYQEEEEELQDDKTKLLYSTTESQPDQYGGRRGRGYGGRYKSWRGRGHGRYRNFQQQCEAYRQGNQRDASHITCLKCDKLRHYANDCPDILLKLQDTTEKKDDDTQEADELMINEVVYPNE